VEYSVKNLEEFRTVFHELAQISYICSSFRRTLPLGCALTFASEAKFEIEAKISFRFEAKKMPDFT
jgi:hypothetical protein